MKSNDAISNAQQVLDMHDELVYLRGYVIELKEYQRKYFDLLDSSMQHNERMLGNVLQLAMTPGVLDACRANVKAG